MVLMHTDFPEPVCSGDQKVGHFRQVRHDHLASDILSYGKRQPGGMTLKLLAFQKVSEVNRTVDSLLGTSMPTADFPGIGASIRISAAARLSLISSASANNPADLYALLRMELIPGNRRAAADIGDGNAHAKVF